MTPRFFIDRPIFSWVIALTIILAGVIALVALPIEQYPTIAPPSLTISAFYPGADAATLATNVTQVIEQQLNGVEGFQYMSSTSRSNGIGIDHGDLRPGNGHRCRAHGRPVRLRSAEPRLPEEVRRQGILVRKAGTGFLMIVALTSKSGATSILELGNFAETRVIDELRRVPGVGDISSFSSPYAMRIWLDPDKLAGFQLSPADALAAVQEQNTQASGGSLGDQPLAGDTEINATILTQNRFTTPEEFESIILRANPDGSIIRLGDVRAWSSAPRAMGPAPSSTGAVRRAWRSSSPPEQTRSAWPSRSRPGWPSSSRPSLRTSLDRAFRHHPFINASVKSVVTDSDRGDGSRVSGHVPVPAELARHADSDDRRADLARRRLPRSVGARILHQRADAVRHGHGDRHPGRRRHRGDRERRAHHGRGASAALRGDGQGDGQITSAIIGITLVLVAVFIPMAFFPGSTGAIYRQFAVTLAISIAFSALMALTLTPALCATLLKPHVPAGAEHPNRAVALWRRFFGGFNRWFGRTTMRYQGTVGRILLRPLRFLAIFVLLVGITLVLFRRSRGASSRSRIRAL
jgi:multidrug efflux pump